MTSARQDLQAVEANLRNQLTLLAIYKQYLRSTDPHIADVHALWESFIEDDEQAVQQLSRQLRTMGSTPVSIRINDKLEGQAGVRQGVGERLRFVRTALERDLAWYQERLAESPSSPELAALWAELQSQDQKHLDALNALIGD